MDWGPFHLSTETLLWAGFVFCGALLIVFRDWWITLTALLGEYALLCVLFALLPFVPRDLVIGSVAVSRLVVVKAVTGLTVIGILAVTVASRRRLHRATEQPLDEITAARLRWAARRTVQREGRERFRLLTYLLPLSAVVVLVAASYTLASLYPLLYPWEWLPHAPTTPLQLTVDLVWYWLGLSGLLIVLLAQEMQEVCVGLLLVISSVDLFYTVLSRGIGLLAIGLFSAVSILLALGAAYLAQVFYMRLRRWQLPSQEEWD